MPQARCILCDEVVELAGVLKGCPKCGTTSRPVDPAEDHVLTINRWELRILCTWAEQWVGAIPKADTKSGARAVLGAIGRRLKAQLPPDASIFMGDELEKIKRLKASGTRKQEPKS